MEAITVILLGLIFGSFLNVVIYRLPAGQNIVTPRSACPACRQPIAFYDNIPVLSYLLLWGKCRHCRKKISLQYPLVEMFTAFSFWFTVQRSVQVSIHTAFSLVFICILIVLALIDLKHMILPDELTLGGSVVFLLYALFNPETPFIEAVMTAIGAAVIFAGIYFFYLKVRKIEGLGFGDVKMMLLLGAFLGLQKLIIALFIASISGVLVGLLLIIFKRKSLKFALPFGTFLSFGAYVAMFFGTQIWLVIRSIYI